MVNKIAKQLFLFLCLCANIWHKVTKEQNDKKVDSFKKKEDISEDTTSKNEVLKKVFKKEDKLNGLKEQKSKIKAKKESVFIFGAEARKSVVEKTYI